jgi:hypothetical protein
LGLSSVHGNYGQTGVNIGLGRQHTIGFIVNFDCYVKCVQAQAYDQ